MKTRALLLALPLLALGPAGCVDNRQSLTIQMVCSVPDTCTFSGECDAEFIGFPTLDVTASALDRLWLFLQVENRLADNADADVKRVNTNDATVDEIVLEYEMQGGFALPRTTLSTSARVPTESASVVSAEVIPASLDPEATLSAYAGSVPGGREMIVKVTMRGTYDDGSDFETYPFPIAVKICAGCLSVATGTLCPTTITCPPQSNGQLPLSCP